MEIKMKIDEKGFFEFNHFSSVKEHIKVVEDSMLLGKINMQYSLYLAWYADYGKKNNLRNDILTWTAVFIPNLQYSIIRYLMNERSFIIESLWDNQTSRDFFND
jgi:hypothetical protein